MHSLPRIGMTLLELLLVVAITGALAALLMPAIQAARETARRSTCQNHLRQIGIALHVHHDAHHHLPVGCIDKRLPRSNPHGRQLAWSAALLAHLEQQPLWQAINFNSAYDSADNALAAASVVSAYLCPSAARFASGRSTTFVENPIPTADKQDRAAAIDYGGIYGAAQTTPSANGVFLYDRTISFREITDGTTDTLAVAEDTGRNWLMNGQWINGENIFDVSSGINTQQDNEIWSDHPGGAMVLWCDSRTTYLEQSLDLRVLRAMCTRAGDHSTNDY